MKKLYTLIIGLFLLGASPAFAQQDPQAQQILDKTIETFRQTDAVSLTFGGSQEGKLILQGDCFYLDCGGIKSWFDGTTQWSYVEENEEVTVSAPTPEELQSVNPYAILQSYRLQYNYRYQGIRTEGGKKNHILLLTPRTANANDIASVWLHISTAYRPTSIRIQNSRGESRQFIIRSYQTVKGLDINSFRFDAKKYPHAEIIDMR